MRIAIYLRISDDREGRELGVDRQRLDCLMLAERMGWTVVEIYMDNDIGASTRSRKVRPDYRRMVRDAKAGRFDAILSYTAARLTRRPRESEDHIELAERHGIRFEYVASPGFDLNTADGRMIARMLAAQDAAESERTGERVTRKRREVANAGGYLGGPRPFGYEADGMTLRADEARALGRWYDEILAGRSITSIAREAGRNHSSMRVILMNPRNAALRLVDGAEREGAWPAIVPPETWRAAVALLTDPARSTHTTSARKWIGSGLYICERCAVSGRATIGSTYSGEANGARRIYKCQPLRGGCARAWDATKLDTYIDFVVRERLALPDVADLLPRDRPDLAGLREERSAKRRKLTRLAEEWADDDDADDAQLKAASRKLRARIAEIDERLATSAVGGALAAVLTAEDPVAAWDAIPAEQVDRRQGIVRGLMTISLGPSPRGRAPYRPELFVGIGDPRRP